LTALLWSETVSWSMIHRFHLKI